MKNSKIIKLIIIITTLTVLAITVMLIRYDSFSYGALDFRYDRFTNSLNARKCDPFSNEKSPWQQYGNKINSNKGAHMLAFNIAINLSKTDLESRLDDLELKLNMLEWDQD